MLCVVLPKSENFKPLAVVGGFLARFASDLVGNPEGRFSHEAAHIIITSISPYSLCYHRQQSKTSVYAFDERGLNITLINAKWPRFAIKTLFYGSSSALNLKRFRLSSILCSEEKNG